MGAKGSDIETGAGDKKSIVFVTTLPDHSRSQGDSLSPDTTMAASVSIPEFEEPKPVFQSPHHVIGEQPRGSQSSVSSTVGQCVKPNEVSGSYISVKLLVY